MVSEKASTVMQNEAFKAQNLVLIRLDRCLELNYIVEYIMPHRDDVIHARGA